MADIKYLLKFGKREHLESLVSGNIYCSNAITFWGIEDKLKIKGQGDILEAGTRMFAQKMIMQHPDTKEVIAKCGKANGLVRIEPAEKMPVFCMFAVYEDDCKVDITGASIINLSDDKKQTIREHFPNADAVAVIPNPEEFIEDVKRSIGTEIKAEKVNYFHIDKGYETTDGEIAMDMEYMKYLMQDASPEKVDGGIRYTFYADYAFRVLFCKDVFFEQEQEYRIVLPNETTPGVRKYYAVNKFERLYKPELLDTLFVILNLWKVVNKGEELEDEAWSKNIKIRQTLDILTSYPNEYLFMSLPMSVWSIVTWLKNARNSSDGTVEIRKITRKGAGVLVLCNVAVTIAFYILLKKLNTPNLIFSTISVVTSFFAASLTMLRSSYYALGYASNDIVLIILWILASIKDPGYIPVVVNFLIFFLNDMYGFICWKKRETAQC